MLATEAQQGRAYRILACPKYEYLTIGEVYECTMQGQHTTAFHRPDNGPGTWLTGPTRDLVAVEPA